MCARKMGRRGGWMRIKDGILRNKKVYCLVKGSAVFCFKRELARIDNYCVFLRCISDYMMASFVL
jgi:hypothetical protein